MLLLVDLDGVVYRGATPVDGVAAVLAERAGQGDEVVYVTNNSMHYRAEYVPRLLGMGAPVEADRIVTSPRATALYLRELRPSVRRVLVLGTRGLQRELADVGLEVVPAAEVAERARSTHEDGYLAAERPDAVVVGLDMELTYGRIAVAADAVRAGARFVATNRDPVYPFEHGLAPGAGAVVAAVETAAGVAAVSIGKPAPWLLEEAARTVGRHAAEAVVIGDGLLTDLPAARAVGARSILMLTGVTTLAQIDGLAPSARPTAVARGSEDLAKILDGLASGETVSRRPSSEGPPSSGAGVDL